MDRGERIGLGAAVAGHVLLFGLLSVGFLATPNPLKLKQQPVQVSLVKDVGLEQTAPAIVEPAQSVAPETGAPEDAAAPAEPETMPEPPKPAPVQPAPPAVKPAPAPRPAPQPRPLPPKPAAAPPAPVKSASKAAAAKPAATKGSGASPTATAARPRGSRLGSDFLKGLSDTPSKSRTESPPAQRVGAQALASIASAILRQVQPCANRQVTPGPGAERIRVTIELKLNADGSLKSRPAVIDHSGVDDENGRYVDRVDDLAIATFTGCSPLRGLPPELYAVPGGWSDFKLRYKLPG